MGLRENMHLFNEEVDEPNSELANLLDISNGEKTRILNATHELFSYYNTNLEIIWANKAAADSLNLGLDDIIGRHCYELWGQGDNPCEDCPVLKAKETGKPHEIEKQTPDGRWWIVRGYPLFDKDGKLTHLVEFSREITEWKNAEQALMESEERYRTLIDQLPGSIFIMKDQSYIFCNPAGAKLLGYENPRNVQGVSVLDTIHPDSIPIIRERIRSAEKGLRNPPTEIKVVTKHGRIIDVRAFSIPITIHDELVSLIIGQDITEEKRSERKEQQYTEELQRLNSSLLEMLELPTVDSLYDYIGKKLSEMIPNAIVIVGEIDVDDETILIKHLSGLNHSIFNLVINKLGANPVGKKYEFRDYLKDVYQKQELYEYPGGLKEFSHGFYSDYVLDKLQKLVGINKIYTIGLRRKNKLFSAVHIFTRRKTTLENKELLEAFLNQSSVSLRRKLLEEENLQLANLVRQSDDAIIQTDSSFHITYMNGKAEKLFGYAFNEIKGKSPSLLKSDSFNVSFQQELYETVSKGETFLGECLNKRKDGCVFWCQMKIFPLYDTDQLIHGYVGFLRDVSNRKKAEQKLKETTEKIQKIIDSSPSGIAVVNVDGIIETWSPACERMFGWSAEEVIGSFNPTVPESKKEFYLKMIKQSYTNMESKALTKDNKLIDILISTAPLYENNEFIGSLGVVTDITEQKKIERQIYESEKKYRTLFNTMAQGVVYQDSCGCIISTNPAAEQILGLSFDQMRGKTSADSGWKAIQEDGSLYPGSKHPAMIALKTGKFVKDVMGVFNPKDNEYKWILVTAIPQFRDDETLPYQTYTSFEDITELKRTQDKLARSEQEYRTLFEEQVNGFAIFKSVFNENGKFVGCRFIDINPAYERITGVKRDEVKGKDIREIFPGTKDDWFQKYGSVAITGNPQIFEMFHQPTNQYFYCNVYRPWDSPDRFCVVFNDVTDRKMAENNLKKAHFELQRLNKTLEEKVLQRTNEIDQLLKLKDEFINQLGHDLKNPLGPLINLIPLLQRDETDPKKLEMLTVINRNVGYMKNLVTKTLELARLNSPNTTFNFERIHLKSKVEDILETNKLLFQQHGIVVIQRVSEDIFVTADDLRLEELFNNLINNAVKYTQDKGSILIDASKKNEVVTISVSDNGIGMTEKQLIHLFDEFYKADTSRHDFDSSGLGMSICKRIVDRHGGRIWVESEGLGKGSTFYFTLPV